MPRRSLSKIAHIEPPWDFIQTATRQRNAHTLYPYPGVGSPKSSLTIPFLTISGGRDRLLASGPGALHFARRKHHSRFLFNCVQHLAHAQDSLPQGNESRFSAFRASCSQWFAGPSQSSLRDAFSLVSAKRGTLRPSGATGLDFQT
jgi:hypothetical protein